MSITDCAVSNGCNCGRLSCRKCRGRKISAFSTGTVISSGTRFTAVNGSGAATENINFTFQTLLNSILAQVPFHEPHVEEHFISISDRDDYFSSQTNRDMLVTDFPISVNVAGVIKFYRWSGIDAPPTYDPNDWLLMAINGPVGLSIVETGTGTYVMDGNEDIIFCSGVVTIDLPAIGVAFKSVIVNADGGTVTMNPAGGDSIDNASIIDGNSVAFGPKLSTTTWKILSNAVGNYS